MSGALATLTYPSGLVVSYDRDPAIGEVTRVRNATTGAPPGGPAREYLALELAQIAFLERAPGDLDRISTLTDLHTLTDRPRAPRRRR